MPPAALRLTSAFAGHLIQLALYEPLDRLYTPQPDLIYTNSQYHPESALRRPERRWTGVINRSAQAICSSQLSASSLQPRRLYIPIALWRPFPSHLRPLPKPRRMPHTVQPLALEPLVKDLQPSPRCQLLPRFEHSSKRGRRGTSE